MTGSTARIVSFIVLLGIVVLFGVLSYEVLSGFVLPMFLAVLLVLIFKPLHVWTEQVCRGRHRLAAGLTTVAVLLIVLLPMAWVLYRASRESIELVTSIDQTEVGHRVMAVVQKINVRLPESVRIPLAEDDLEEFLHQMSASVWTQLKGTAEPLARGATQVLSVLLGVIVGLTVMMLSFYYFLADGPALLETFTSLAPIQDAHKRELTNKFSVIARAVIVAMTTSAVAQGVLSGLGYYFAGLHNIFLLSVLTMMFALVPFLGATIIWVPCVLWLFFYEDRPTAAIILAVYGVAVVSMADNFIKPLILHGQSNLHPLLGLLSVLGGATALGPIGILVGPMVVALLQTGVFLLRQEMATLDDKQSPASASTESQVAVKKKSGHVG